MYDLCEAVKTCIWRFVVKPIALNEDLQAGDNVISVESARRFQPGDEIAVYRVDDSETGAQIRNIQCVYTDHRIVLDSGVQSSFPASTSYVQKTVQGEFIRGIHNGDPPVLRGYPCICVNSVRQENERWLIGGVDKQKFYFDIILYGDASRYQEQHEALLTWERKIRDGLFRSFRPLVQPYTSTILASPYDACDTMIHVQDVDCFPRCDWVLVEDIDHTRGTRILANCGGGYYQISPALQCNFGQGATVIQEHRFLYSTDVPSVTYAGAEKDRSVKAAVISYVCHEAVQRPMFNQDPMLF